MTEFHISAVEHPKSDRLLGMLYCSQRICNNP